MGRLLVYLARLNEPDGKPLPLPGRSIRGIGVEQAAALLVEPDGSATVVGKGDAYFVDASHADGRVESGKPLNFGDYALLKVAPGHKFNLKTWTGDATPYTLSVHAGAVRSSQPGNAIY